LCFPDREKIPFSMIRTAGKSWSGIDSRIAMESERSQLWSRSPGPTPESARVGSAEGRDSRQAGIGGAWMRFEFGLTEELNSLNEFIVLWQIDDHHRLNLIPIRRISHDSSNGKEE
jgi:hypothetical protein